jgi:hypothetical protein
MCLLGHQGLNICRTSIVVLAVVQPLEAGIEKKTFCDRSKAPKMHKK